MQHITYDQMLEYTRFDQIIENGVYLRFLWTVAQDLATLHFSTSTGSVYTLGCLFIIECLVNRIPSANLDEAITFIKRSI